jgi:hypothetical protein
LAKQGESINTGPNPAHNAIPNSISKLSENSLQVTTMANPTTRKTMQNEQEDMLAVLIGGANIVFSIISHWFKPSALK